MIPCKEATLVVRLSGGLGYQIPKSVTNAINSVLQTLGIKYRIEGEGGLSSVDPLTIDQLVFGVEGLQGRREGSAMKRVGIASMLAVVSSCVLVGGCGRSKTPGTQEQATRPAADRSESAPNQVEAPARSSTAPPLAQARRAACSYITRVEMAEILGASIGKPSADEAKSGTTSCVYPPGDAGSYSQAEVTIEWEHGDAPSFERLLVNAFGGSALGRQVAHDVHLGDEASYSSEGVLSARTGQTLVTITLPMRPGSEEKALAIGRKLFERLGAATAPVRTDAAPSAAGRR